MDLADIKRVAIAAREFTHVFEKDATKVTFTLRLPTPFEAECVAVGGGVGMRGARDSFVRAQRGITELAIVGWTGMYVRDLLPGHKHGDDELPFEPAAVSLVLDERRDIAEALWDPLVEKLEARNKAREATAKNSPRASPGARARKVRATSQPKA
jgi:hypothetical protein